MKKTSKVALVAAALLAVATSANAAYLNGSLLLGFTQGAGNDYILSIGQFSSLVNGQTWVLPQITPGQVGGVNLNNLAFGVIGAQNTGSIIYSTVASGDTLPSLASFSQTRVNVQSVGSYVGGTAPGTFGTPAFNSANGWFQQTDQPGAPSGNIYQVNFANPNVTTPSSFTSGTVVADFYANTGGANPTSAKLGWFTFDTTGTVTWTAVPVPEPSTYGVIAGAGVLLVTLRRRFVAA